MRGNQPFSEHWSTRRLISESSHYQTFIIQVCALLGVPAPDDEQTGDPDYCFERKVVFEHEDGTSHSGFIDCYRKGSFVLEAKQSARRTGAAGDAVDSRSEKVEGLMRAAKRQAEQYAKALDEWPPFLIVVDVGRAIELWSDFARQGKVYAPFPDRARQRITLERLDDPEVRAMLAAIWTDPMSLDPAARVAAVTTDIADRLGWLVRSIGTRGPGPADLVAHNAFASKTALYVMQCIFAMFADSVGLIERRGFLELLKSYRGDAANFHRGATDFFNRMDTGGHCTAVRQDLRRFNGGLFRDVAAIPITEDELEALIEAAGRDWASVEPAIFGSLLEGALDSRERSELGAHYTPRAFVERLVGPTVIEPLRADWEAIEAVAIGFHRRGSGREAQRMVRRFHQQLCSLRVLDPACGTGNFLYVAMGMLKELEGEVLGVLAELGDAQGMLNLSSHSVSPEQFLGIEKNRYAAWIAQMVLWIGHLQWHFRIFGDAKPTEPILKDAGSIRRGDAILEYDRIELDLEATARRARLTSIGGLFDMDDGREVLRYVNPRQPRWPEADFIVGNPPFMGAKDMRRELGDGYVDALWASRQGRFRSADLVTVWWDMAAEALKRKGSRLRRFGFITTNSITQTFSRRVIESHLTGVTSLRIAFAIADHPWIKGGSRAAVRIAMTVAERGWGEKDACLARVVSESGLESEAPVVVVEETFGEIGADLTLAHDPVLPLRANAGLCSRGVQLMGAGFAVMPEQAARLHLQSAPGRASPARPYRNGRDLADRPRGLLAIDFFGHTDLEARRAHPGFYQHLLETVKVARDRNNRASYRDNWWLFGEPRRELRTALRTLPRYIATAETAKHRWFRFVDAEVLPDNKLVVVASEDAGILGVLSSRAHAVWFAAYCGRIGVYDGDAVYVKGACFDTFPFPVTTALQHAEIAALAEELEEVRTRALEGADASTMTTLYNVRDRWRSGCRLSDEERRVFDVHCVGVIDHLHQRIDRCVGAAYGWPEGIDDVQMLQSLQRLNAERTSEEATGVVRFLRPDFQAARRATGVAEQTSADLRTPVATSPPPASPEGMAAVLIKALRGAGRPLESDALLIELGAGKGRRMQTRVAETLAILSVGGTVRKTDAGWFAPR